MSLSPNISTTSLVAGGNERGGFSKHLPERQHDDDTDSQSEEAPEYSLDDFDGDTPAKREASPPPAPPPTDPSGGSKATASGPSQMDDIKQRWLNPTTSLTSMRMFDPVEEEENPDAEVEKPVRPKTSTSSDTSEASGESRRSQEAGDAVPCHEDSDEDYRFDGDAAETQEEVTSSRPHAETATRKPFPAKSQDPLSPPRPTNDSGMTTSISSPPPPPSTQAPATEHVMQPPPQEGQAGQNVMHHQKPYYQSHEHHPQYQQPQYMAPPPPPQPPQQQYYYPNPSSQYPQYQEMSSQQRYFQQPYYPQAPHTHMQPGPTPPLGYPSAPFGSTEFAEAGGADARRVDNQGGRVGIHHLTSTEVDPRQVLLSQTMQSQHFAPTGRLTDLTRGTSWDGSDLPVVPPSATELHAHIASVAASNKQQVASSVKLLKEKKTNGATAAAKRRSQSSGKAAMESDVNSIRRIEIGNSRLLRQFEELDREIRAMKSERSRPRPDAPPTHKKGPPAPPRIVAASKGTAHPSAHLHLILTPLCTWLGRLDVSPRRNEKGTAAS